MTTTAAQVVEALLGADLRAVQNELKQLAAVRDWAIRQTGFAVGDKVVIDSAMPCPGGWSPYAEALQGGVGTVQDIDFNTFRDTWYAEIMLDREWSTAPSARYWHGPVADTPEGMQAPTSYEQLHHPDGRKHVFMIRLKWLSVAP